MTLWTAAQAAAATGGQAIGDWQADGVSIDTRTLQAGDLFVALTAARDGHDFVADALARGAAAALVSRRPEGVPEDAPLLLVEDVQSALEALGRAARARSGARVVAVTGSVGKTSTKEMLRTVLGGQGRTHAAEASYNNHWGVPLTLARMPADTEFAVIEIGMNHPGEIAPLARLARPHVAIVTNIAPAHIEAFGTLEGIAREKSDICAGLEPGGAAVMNADLPTSPILFEAAQAAQARLVRFGTAEDAEIRLDEATLKDDATIARAQVLDAPGLFKLAAPGRHYAMNALAVLGAAAALELDLALALTDLGRWRPGAGRGKRERIVLDPGRAEGALELIDDAYNANPASMAAALEVLAAATPGPGPRGRPGRRIAYLGDMAELGDDAPRLHAEIAALAAMQQIDVVHCTGLMTHHLAAALPPERRGRWAETAEEMARGVARDLEAGDIVLVKASNATGLGRVVDVIRKLGHAPQQTSRGDA